MNNKMKKTDLDRKLKFLKDSGDVRKSEKIIARGSGPVTKINKNCDRGDSIAKFAIERVKFTEKRLVDVLPRNLERLPSQLREHEGKTKDLKEMRRIKEFYTIRSKYYVKRIEIDKHKSDKSECEVKNDRVSKPKEIKAAPTSSIVSPVKSPSSSVKTELKRKMPSKAATLSQQVIRRPIIKTITSRDDKHKVYKAVNFVERRAHPTQLQINMPTIKNKKETKSNAKLGGKEKRKKESYPKPPLSPDVAVKIKSPPTEMAKWANVDHTKVYYEAWVNTTLAAISKKVKDKNFDKNNLMKTVEEALAGRVSPDIDYKMLLDEKYTGKIKVNKR